MLKSLWRWVQRDRIFAALLAGISVLGLALIALVWFSVGPTKPMTPTPGAAGNNSNPTAALAAPSQTPSFSLTLASTTSNDPFATPSPLIVKPDPTQIAQLPNQGQNPAPPPPPNLSAQTPKTSSPSQPTKTSSLSQRPPTPTPVSAATPTKKR